MEQIDVADLMTLEEAAEQIGAELWVMEELVLSGLVAGAYGVQDLASPALTDDSPLMVIRKDLDALDQETLAATGFTMKQLAHRVRASMHLAEGATRSVQ